MIRSRVRPQFPRINRNSPLAKGLVFAGLGGGASTLKMVDASGYGNDGTLTNMDPATDWSRDLGRSVLDFDGSNDYVLFPGGFWPTTFMVSVWARPPSGNNRLFTADAENDTFCIDISDGGWRVFGYEASTAKGFTKSGGFATYDANAWQHISCGFDGAKWYHAKNGVQTTTNAAATLNAASSWYLGHRPGIGYWTGSAADLLIHSRLLSLAEISALADPSNVMLSVGGVPLILPPHRVSFPAAVAETPSGFKPYWARNVNTLIGGGV